MTRVNSHNKPLKFAPATKGVPFPDSREAIPLKCDVKFPWRAPVRVMMARVLFVFVVVISESALACGPAERVMVPPTEPDGEFTYEYPSTELEQFITRLSESNNHAVVTVYLDHHRGSYPHNAQTEFRVLHGWGKPQPEVVKFIRKETSCGKPEKLGIEKRYVAIFQAYGPPQLIPYERVELQVKELGKPDYAYTPIGLLPR